MFSRNYNDRQEWDKYVGDIEYSIKYLKYFDGRKIKLLEEIKSLLISKELKKKTLLEEKSDIDFETLEKSCSYWIKREKDLKTEILLNRKFTLYWKNYYLSEKRMTSSNYRVFELLKLDLRLKSEIRCIYNQQKRDRLYLKESDLYIFVNQEIQETKEN